MQEIRYLDSVYAGEGIWQRLNEHLELKKYGSIFILTDSNTAVHCLPYLTSKLPKKWNLRQLQIKAGESYKNIESCLQIWEELSSNLADRHSLLINLGGGVVTDLGGFVASTFKRGIDFINIPTSLLAMVDASIGGKNGVDLGVLKNQIGVINEPELVLMDIKFLDTLPPAHKVSGLAEMLKHGLIASESYFNRLLRSHDSSMWLDLIWESVEIKHKIVTEDRSEEGSRKFLNFGHTLGHAIESHYLDKADGEAILHGEAVAIGMILAAYISTRMRSLSEEKRDTIANGILEFFDKRRFSEKDIEAILGLLIYDKKNRGGKILFVLINDFGKPIWDCEVPDAVIRAAFNYYKNL